MKKTAIALALGVAMASCNNKEKKAEVNLKDSTTTSQTEPSKTSGSVTATEIDWKTIPEVKEIGEFTFFKAPEGIKIVDEKAGLTDVFENEMLENYTGTGVYTTKGKLGIIAFADEKSQNFNQRFFNQELTDYISKIGAKQLYSGNYPANDTANEALRQKLKGNIWNGKGHTFALSDDEPFAVYAFRNNGKNYIVNVQTNSAQGYIFIMELKA